jgi:hypothetical protein
MFAKNMPTQVLPASIQTVASSLTNSFSGGFGGRNLCLTSLASRNDFSHGYIRPLLSECREEKTLL